MFVFHCSFKPIKLHLNMSFIAMLVYVTLSCNGTSYALALYNKKIIINTSRNQQSVCFKISLHNHFISFLHS